MRYDKEIYFVTEGDVYNYNTGNYDTVETVKDKQYANISYLSEERKHLAYGNIKQDVFVIRLQNQYDKPFDYVKYDGQKYGVDSQKKLRRDHVLWVSGL